MAILLSRMDSITVPMRRSSQTITLRVYFRPQRQQVRAKRTITPDTIVGGTREGSQLMNGGVYLGLAETPLRNNPHRNHRARSESEVHMALHKTRPHQHQALSSRRPAARKPKKSTLTNSPANVRSGPHLTRKRNRTLTCTRTAAPRSLPPTRAPQAYTLPPHYSGGRRRRARNTRGRR